jgi:myo-inositol-1(or 4)-monophosphatase
MVHDGGMTKPSELLEIARNLAREVGEMIVRARTGDVTVATTKSSDIDPVTAIDIAAEKLLRERLSGLRPDDAVLGEEGAETPGTSEVTWVLDPIDGTVNYLYGLPHYAVSVAAVSGGPGPKAWTMEAGAVFEGGTGRLYSAGRGLGAWVQQPGGQPARIEPQPGPILSRTLLGTGFQYIAERRAIQGAVAAKLLPQVRDIRRLGSCALDLCYVAAGNLDAYYEHGLNPWDFAAGALIAREAGVRVEGWDGAPPDPTFAMAARPETFEALHEALSGAGARTMWATPKKGV